MRMNEVEYSDVQPIDGYGPGFFRIGGKVHEAPVAILPGGIASWEGYDDPEPLLAARNSLDVLLVGTGADIAHIPAEFRNALEAAGIGVEVMSSPQACRTYNVLLGEGRRIGLAALSI